MQTTREKRQKSDSSSRSRVRLRNAGGVDERCRNSYWPQYAMYSEYSNSPPQQQIGLHVSRQASDRTHNSQQSGVHYKYTKSRAGTRPSHSAFSTQSRDAIKIRHSDCKRVERTNHGSKGYRFSWSTGDRTTQTIVLSFRNQPLKG